MSTLAKVINNNRRETRCAV